MTIFQSILGRLGLVQGATNSVRYNFGPVSADIPEPLQDWTVYRLTNESEVLSIEHETLNQTPQQLIDAVTVRINASSINSPLLSPISPVVLNQTCVGFSGQLELPVPSVSPEDPPASSEPVQLSVVIIGGSSDTVRPPVRLTYMSAPPVSDGFSGLLANVENANANGPIPTGSSRCNLGGLLLDVPSSYSTPAEYRFGAGNSLIVTLSFPPSSDPISGPEDFVWWNPAVDQLTASADLSSPQSINVGNQTGEVTHWTVHHIDGSSEATDDWSVWRLALPFAADTQLIALGKATGSDTPVLDNIWPQFVNSLTIPAS